MASPRESAQEFLRISSQFQLGSLQTESFHPVTAQLSQTLHSDVKAGIKLLKEVDQMALEKIRLKGEDVFAMSNHMHKVLSAGGKVFFCGCGATGRLSLVIETLYRQVNPTKNNVISFMAGGDFALIKSVESFEDQTSFGEKQLIDLGFKDGDLLIASTEGGETPFVIGAALKAAEVSSQGAYFLYCNPNGLLRPLDRCRLVLGTNQIKKINLANGPMAISGSTRMQASTVLMLAAGSALLNAGKDQVAFLAYWENTLKSLMDLDYEFLALFVKEEAGLYKEGKFLNYISDDVLGISILTDTTERSPTFSLSGFENKHGDLSKASLSYLFIDGENSEAAWKNLLARAPRALNWPELEGKINLEQIYGFDISIEGFHARSARVKTEMFEISHQGDHVLFKLKDHSANIPVDNDILLTHLKVKVLLNTLSTSIMGLLGRYEGNVMTWVRASNNKLIDRAARYVTEILKQKNLSCTYEQIVTEIFSQIDQLNENEPIVLKVVKVLTEDE